MKAALAYLLPPITGLFAYVLGAGPRTRKHGLQSVVFGSLWPAALYLCSALSPTATQVGFAAGLLVWALLFAGTALGIDLVVPGTGRLLERAARSSPRDFPR